jgi:hypothetical protein
MTDIAIGAPVWTPELPAWLKRGWKALMSTFWTQKGFANATAALHAYASRPLYLGWGTSSGQTASSNDLATAANESRVSGTSSQQTTTVTNDTYQVTGTITAGGARAITELGIFDAAGTGNPPSGGNMCLYGDFSVINLATNDSIAFTFKGKVA